MSIQNLSFNSVSVSFNNNGFLNATQIAAHFGKQPRDYLKTEQTQQYISALAEHLSSKTKILVEENQLVVVKNGRQHTRHMAASETRHSLRPLA
nr:KilA-N domain-containing protein [Kingella potus]